MSTVERPWTVLPHGDLEKHEDNLWSVAGSLPDMPLGRRMVLMRRADERLVVHNAIALAEPAMAELERFGEPAFLVVPNGWHRLDAAAWKKRYPAAQVVVPKGARKRVGQVVQVDLPYEDFPADEAVRVETLEGVAKSEGVWRVRSGRAESLVLNDALMNLTRGKGLWWWAYALLGSTGGPKVTPIFRLGVVKDKKALAEHYRRLAEAPGLTRIIPGHGAIIETDAAEVLRGVAGKLSKP